MCGAYQATAASDRWTQARARCGGACAALDRQSTAAIATKAMPKFGSVHVPMTPAARTAAIGHVRPARVASRAPTTKSSHGAERDPVAASLPRQVEEKWRERHEEEEEDARQRRDANVQPRRHEPDAEEEGNDRPEPQGDLGLPEDGARRPAEQAEELVVVRDVAPGQDLARAGAYEVRDGDDLVVPVAAVEPVEPRADEQRPESRVRPGHEGSGHIKRQRTSVRSTRSPSTAVSFLPASRPRAL